MRRILPFAFVALLCAWVLSTLLPPHNKTDFDLVGFGKLPVLVDGRVKPIDSVARTTLLMLQGHQSVKDADGKSIAPEAWILDMLVRPKTADTMQVFAIVNPDVLTILHLKPADGAGDKLFSFDQLRPRVDEVERQAQMASQVDNGQRDAFQRAVLQLHENLALYQRIRFSLQTPDTKDLLSDLKRFQDIVVPGSAAVRAKEANKPYDEKLYKEILDYANRFSFIADNAGILMIPPSKGEKSDDWRNVGKALEETFGTGEVNPNVLAYAGLAYAWQAQRATDFNEIVRLYHQQLAKTLRSDVLKSSVEARFNSAEPFATAYTLYVIAFLLAIISWVAAPEVLGRTAFGTMVLAFVVATIGIILRMWLEGRPPVTNLYSSALFVGWVAVALCIVLEYFYRNAVASVAGGFVGFCTLVIAQHLALGGDTMEMMRAVLDSNFWLATHVVTVTVGYGATYLAGFLALIYVVRGVFTKSLDQNTADSLQRMVYGIVCFATLFSLIGTILGGIWADQSWGRFWGWDPKENGALIIVLWNAVILHARWGGMVRQRGLMGLAIFGNIVTSWSWFGTNMLGVGLHSYGFMAAAFYWLIAFVLSQLAFIAIATLPIDRWRSKLRA